VNAGPLSFGNQGTIPFPACDPEAISQTARVFASAGVQLLGTRSGLGSGVAALAGDWRGRAATVWVTDGLASQARAQHAADAMTAAAAALSRLSGALADARAAYQTAVQAEHDARFSQAVLPAVPAPISPKQAAAATLAADRLAQALTAERVAVELAGDAALVASIAFWEIMAGAPHTGAGGPPSAAWVSSSGHRPADAFLVTLFGSIANNRIAGLKFQGEVLKGMGVPENFQNFKVAIKGGRVVGVRPDAKTGSTLEVKGGRYTYNSRQMKALNALAEQDDEPEILVIRPGAKVSATVQEAIEELNARKDVGRSDVYRSLGGGRFTDYTGTKFFRVNPETHQLEQVALDPADPLADDPDLASQTPDPPQAPDPPETPEPPELPELEIP
jgi:hypothetical protein